QQLGVDGLEQPEGERVVAPRLMTGQIQAMHALQQFLVAGLGDVAGDAGGDVLGEGAVGVEDDRRSALHPTLVREVVEEAALALARAPQAQEPLVEQVFGEFEEALELAPLVEFLADADLHASSPAESRTASSCLRSRAFAWSWRMESSTTS